MTLEQREHVIPIPRRVAEFDGLRVPPGCRLQERPQPLDVAVPPGRQLVENRAEAAEQVRGAVEDALDRFHGVAQPLQVREVAAGLHREEEARRDAPAPCGECRRFG
jgi:hypothetical protein